MKLFFLMFALFILLSNASFSQWESCNNGSDEQSISTFIVDGNKILVGTGAGVYSSTNNGSIGLILV